MTTPKAKKVLRVASRREQGASRAGMRFGPEPVDLEVVNVTDPSKLKPGQITKAQATQIKADTGLLIAVEVEAGAPINSAEVSALEEKATKAGEALAKEQEAHEATLGMLKDSAASVADLTEKLETANAEITRLTPETDEQ